MTITPMPVLPAASRGAGSRATDAKPGKAADDFAAVLDGQLNGTKTAAGKASDSKRHAVSKDSASAGVAPDDAQAAAQPGDVPANGLTAVPVEALVVAVPVTTPATATSTSSADATAGATGTTAIAVAGVPAATEPTATTETTADPATPHQALPPAGEPKAHSQSAAAEPATPHQATPSAEPLPDLAIVTTGTKAPGLKASTAAVAPDQPEPSTATPAAGVTAPTAPATETSAAGPAQPVAPSPVLAQVTPALARVVTRGDGEHRLMLKLHPADLGEIHLTVTVRGEHVDVEIAAGAQARDVLRDGSAHLRSMLESIGRSTGQLVLRDLPSAPAQPSSGAGLDAGAQQDGRGTSYAGTDDSRRDRSGTGAGRQPATAEQHLDRPVPTRPASPRTTVPGASALDVTV